MDASLYLRKELDRLTSPPNRLNLKSPQADWDAWLTDQVRDIAELGKKHPHNIRLHTQCSATEERNCFMFALDIEADAIRDKCEGSIFPGKKFVQKLLGGNFLRAKNVPLNNTNEDDVLIYFCNGIPEHAGKWMNDKIVSKWGAGPTHIWEHDIYEVPESYGNEVGAFERRGDMLNFTGSGHVQMAYKLDVNPKLI